jgi:cytochrome c peroxidase
MKSKMFALMALLMLFAMSCKNSSQPLEEEQNKAPEYTQADKDLLGKAQAFFKVLPSEAPNPENPVTPEKVTLGKALYFETQLSQNGTQSCNTCHNLNTFGVDNLATSPGDNGKPGTRNSPTTFNSALRTAQFWDGRNKDVEEQAGGPVMNPAEMGMPDETIVVERLNSISKYKELFAAAFPNESEPISFVNMQKSIGAFERTLLTPAPFDQYLGGEINALSEQQRKGLQTFLDNGCASCHNGPLLGGNMLMKVGLFGDYHEMMRATVIDEGKYEETKVESDKGMFFSPGLRNVAKTGPYFHSGTIDNLEEAIQIIAKLQLNKDLSAEEAQDIAVFFNSLTGDIPEEVKTDPHKI